MRSAARLAPPLLLLVLAPFANLRTAQSASAPTPEAPPYSVPSTENPGCSSILENFCDALWAPGHEGNILLRHGVSGTEEPGDLILLGRAANQTSYPYRLFGEAKLAARPYLPAPLLKRLNARHYFEKLQHNLAAKPLPKMSRAEVEANRQLYQDLADIWEAALEECAIDAVTRDHPGFFRLTEEHMPTGISQEYYRAKDRLETEANRAIWSHHPRWPAMQALLDEIKRDLVAAIDSSPGPSAELKDAWKKRIAAIQLMLPGSDPELLDDHDRHCASTERNAVYWTLRDRLEICGGYIMNGDPSRTVAHELAHSLGVHRNEVAHLLASPLAERLSHLRDRTCAKDYISCADWAKWKMDFESDLASYQSGPDLDTKMLACFQTREIKGPPDPSTLDFIAREWVSSNLEDQAQRDRLIRLTKDEEILRDGSKHPNPAYLDPCGLYYVNILRDPINPSYTLNTFFVNEYRCHAAGTPDSPAKHLEDAVEGARKLELDLRARELASASRFSSIRELERHGYAEDVEEDLADNLGEIVYASYLKRLDREDDRRAEFFSSMASLCDEPSLEKLYPEEAQVQKKYDLDPHSEGIDRRRKLMTAPIREALGCHKDFDAGSAECDWRAQQAAPAPAKRD